MMRETYSRCIQDILFLTLAQRHVVFLVSIVGKATVIFPILAYAKVVKKEEEEAAALEVNKTGLGEVVVLIGNILT
jgi:hypothetical protein